MGLDLLSVRGSTDPWRRTVGPVPGVAAHYAAVIGVPAPLHVNPAEFLLESVSADFAADGVAARARLDVLHAAWAASPHAARLAAALADAEARADAAVQREPTVAKPGMPSLVLTLLHRSFIKSYRDVVAYGIRFAMYTGRQADGEGWF